jgi:hypothetical protein
VSRNTVEGPAVPSDSLIPTPQQILGWIEEVFSQGVRRPGYPADRWTPMYLLDSQDTLDKIHEPSLVPVTRAAVRIIEDLAVHTAAGLRAGVRPWDGPPLLG